MEDLLGFIVEFVLEVLIQLIFEASVDVASRANRPSAHHAAKGHREFRVAPFLRSTLGGTNPPWTVLKFTLFGLGSGFLSLLLFPHPLVHPSKLHGVSLLISPVITGLVMGAVGRMARHRGKIPIQIESFAYGCTFAFAFSLIRILMLH